MVRYLTAFIALGLAGPALANEPAPPRPAPDAAKVAELLSNPLVQEIVAATVDQYADALLQTHVGPVAKLADPHAHIRPEDTLGDIAQRDHPNYRRDLHDQTRGAVAAAGQTAHDIAALSSEMRATTARLRALLAQTKAQVDAVR